MVTTASKAGRVPSKRSARLLSCIRIVAIHSLDVLGGVAVEGYLRLTRICSCVGVKCLKTDDIPGNRYVCLNLLFGQLYSAKDDREPAALMGSKHVIWLTILGVATMENGGEALVKTINEVVAHGNRKANILAEGENCVGDPFVLVVRKDRGGDKGTITILVGLTNLLKYSMGLAQVARADFMKDRSADLWPSKLSDLLFNLKADLECVSVP
jgi:hypothetical protein